MFTMLCPDAVSIGINKKIQYKIIKLFAYERELYGTVFEGGGPCILEILSFLKYQIHRVKRSSRYLLTQRVKAYLQQKPDGLEEEERVTYLKFLRYHLIKVFNYPYTLNYLYRKVKVILDDEKKLYYVITEEGHRLYFKRGLTKKGIIHLYNGLCTEQDDLSPHNYDFDHPSITSDTVIADIGSAEGNFSLKHVDKIKKLYLFEPEREWIEALEATFRPWAEKVVIVNKYVSDRDEGAFISLDTYFRDKEKPTLIKADVEGAENEVLNGSCRILDGSVKDILLCTYHRGGDAQHFSELLLERKYEVKFSPGRMFFIWENPDYSLEAPFDFRKGLIHAVKK